MGRTVLLAILWTAAIAGLVSTSAVTNCLDDRCNRVRVVAQNQPDVEEVAIEYPRAQDVDFHGNLLDAYQHPQAAQWRKLNLSYNLLTKDMFSYVGNNYLKVVDLTYNRLQTVSVPSSVVEFIAERNQLHHVTIAQRSSLQRLILPKNKIDSLDKIRKLPNLQELDLSCNDLAELKIDQLPVSLQKLKLARNHIHSISGTNSLPSLEHLDLSHNLLTTVLDFHVMFSSVRKLYLQNNKIVMWINEDQINQQFQELNLLDNDWDCNNLEKVLKKMNGRIIQVPAVSESTNCRTGNNFICCTRVESPYSDRLIKYRKQEFKALQEGTAQRTTGNYSCSGYEPNPCDGDDNLVYSVAGSAVTNAKSLAESSVKELNQTLLVEMNLVAKLEQNVASLREENNELSRVHSDLVTYIVAQHSKALSKTGPRVNGKPDEVGKLQELFTYYETENEKIRQEINAEERRSQDKLNEVNTLETEMEDLNYQQDRLAEEVAKRNATVNAYKAKIEALQKQLG